LVGSRDAALLLYFCSFFFPGYHDHRDLHSFPTRRSSDLVAEAFVLKVLHKDGHHRRGLAHNARVKQEHCPFAIGALAWNARSLEDRKSTRLNSSHVKISYAVFCLKKKKQTKRTKTSSLHR